MAGAISALDKLDAVAGEALRAKLPADEFAGAVMAHRTAATQAINELRSAAREQGRNAEVRAANLLVPPVLNPTDAGRCDRGS